MSSPVERNLHVVPDYSLLSPEMGTDFSTLYVAPMFLNRSITPNVYILTHLVLLNATEIYKYPEKSK